MFKIFKQKEEITQIGTNIYEYMMKIENISEDEVPTMSRLLSKLKEEIKKDKKTMKVAFVVDNLAGALETIIPDFNKVEFMLIIVSLFENDYEGFKEMPYPKDYEITKAFIQVKNIDYYKFFPYTRDDAFTSLLKNKTYIKILLATSELLVIKSEENKEYYKKQIEKLRSLEDKYYDYFEKIYFLTTALGR